MLSFLPGRDAIPPPLMAISFLREGNLDLDEFDPIYGWATDQWVMKTQDIGATRHHVVSRWAPGNGIFAIPFFAGPVLLGIAPGMEDQLSVQKFAASVMASLSVLFVYLACRVVASRRGATWAAIAYALGTCTFVYSSQDLWEHTPAQMWLALALWCVMTAQAHPRRHWLAGLALGFAVLCRQVDAFYVIAIVVYVGWRYGLRRWPAYIVAGLPGALILVAYNLYYFDSIMFKGYVGIPQGGFCEAPSGAIWGILGLWISPSRGMLVYSPFVLFAIYGAWRAWRDGDSRYSRFATCLVPTLVAVLVVHGCWKSWHGTFGYSCRYATDGMVFWALLLAVVIDRVLASKPKKLLFAVLLGWSIFVHAIGSYHHPYNWNAPAEDRYPGGLSDACWRWDDWQIWYQMKEIIGYHEERAHRTWDAWREEQDTEPQRPIKRPVETND
jgi:dolichyl-phosphate-mannose-protein mannosyltransferase